MQWWSWLIIWGTLVIALVVMLVLFAIQLFRKFVRTLETLGELGDKVATALDIEDHPEMESPRNAILEGYATVAARREREREIRLAIKDERRQERLARGKLLIHSVPTRRT